MPGGPPERGEISPFVVLVHGVSVVRRVGRVELALAVLRHESSQSFVDQNGVRGIRANVPGVAKELLVNGRAHPNTRHATTIALLCYEIRVKSLIQFVSHVSPPSVENACSQRGDAVSTRDHV